MPNWRTILNSFTTPTHREDGKVCACPACTAPPGAHITYPHCDNRVLHAPGVCIFCDQHPEMQAQRQLCDINFTGEDRPELAPCPAMAARGVTSLNAWAGNIASVDGKLKPIEDKVKVAEEKEGERQLKDTLTSLARKLKD